MIERRSSSSLIPANPIVVPGTVASGSARNLSSTSSVHTIPDRRRESEYANSGTAPAARPKTPQCFGPVLLRSSEWHAIHR